tara:strand:- start:5881 stop:6090 length:210 start_codon:yes stop_codon:yes gene_type:complete
MENKNYTDLSGRLIRIEERVISLFKICSRIEMQQEKIDKNKNDLTVIKTWGTISIFIVPLIVSIIIGRI